MAWSCVAGITLVENSSVVSAPRIPTAKGRKKSAQARTKKRPLSRSARGKSLVKKSTTPGTRNGCAP